MNQGITYVFLAGYGNSIAEHWQAKWFREIPDSIWIEQKSWDYPICEDWVKELENTLESIDYPVVIIAHSLGCLTFVEWARQNPDKCRGKIKAAFLVAVPDADAEVFPKDIQGYQCRSLETLPVKSLMIASSNDPYASVERSTLFANKWGSELILIGEKGHINLSAGLGEWEEGKKYLLKFVGEN